MTGGGIAITGEQRDALYKELLAHISGIDDLRLAIEEEAFTKADRLAREFTDDLCLIFDGLGWGNLDAVSVELTTPPADLRRILRRLRDQMAERYETERPEQEAFRAQWDHTALVRDTCSQLLTELESES
jgi:hypothetical protein